MSNVPLTVYKEQYGDDWIVRSGEGGTVFARKDTKSVAFSAAKKKAKRKDRPGVVVYKSSRTDAAPYVGGIGREKYQKFWFNESWARYMRW